jgi:hypothetical protein
VTSISSAVNCRIANLQQCVGILIENSCEAHPGLWLLEMLVAVIGNQTPLVKSGAVVSKLRKM